MENNQQENNFNLEINKNNKEDELQKISETKENIKSVNAELHNPETDRMDSEDILFEENEIKKILKKNNKSNFIEKNKKNIIFLSFFLLLISFLGIYFFIKNFFNNGTKKPNIEILIQKSEIPAESSFPWKIKINNSGNVDMKNINLEIKFSTKNLNIISSDTEYTKKDNGVYLVNIEKILSGKSFELSLEGTISSFPGDSGTIYITTKYSLEGTDKVFMISENKNFDVVRPIILSEISSLDQNIASGDKVKLNLKIINKEKNEFKNVLVKLYTDKEFVIDETSLPENFKKIEEENYILFNWEIENLIGNREIKYEILGEIKGKDQEKKVFLIETGIQSNEEENGFVKFSDDSIEILISAPVIESFLEINSSKEFINLDRNEFVKFKIIIKNEGTENAKNLVSEIEMPNYFDLSKISGISPEINGRKVFINSKNFPKLISLPPKESIEIEFEIKSISEFFELDNKSENISFNIFSTIFENEKEISKTNSVKVNVNSYIDFQTNKAFYYRTSSDFPENRGPIPPKVNEETTYVIHWVLESGSNDLKNIEISDVLLSGVKYENSYFVSKGSFEYDQINRKILWKIPKIESFTGSISQKEVIECWFQVSIEPTISDIGQIIYLDNGPKITSIDEFTGEIISKNGNSQNTSIPEDINARRENMGGIVVE